MGRRYRFFSIFHARRAAMEPVTTSPKTAGPVSPAPTPRRFAARFHVIAFALPRPRFAAQTAGPVSPAPTPRRFAAAPDSGAPSTRWDTVIGSAEPCSAECFRERPAALADHGSALPLFLLFSTWRAAPESVRAKGGWGWTGALSAMDGAKRGPQDAASAVPRPTPATLRQLPAPALKPAARGSHPFATANSGRVRLSASPVVHSTSSSMRMPPYGRKKSTRFQSMLAP